MRTQELHPIQPVSADHLAMRNIGARLASGLKAGERLSHDEIMALVQEFRETDQSPITKSVGAAANLETKKDFLKPTRHEVLH